MMHSLVVRRLVWGMVAWGGMIGAAWAEVKIGINLPLTGFAASDGKSGWEGAKLAVAHANAKGGINGEKIELIAYDDQANPKESPLVAAKLVERDRVVGAASGSYSGATRAAAGVFQAAQIPYVTAYAAHPDITLAGDYMFRVCTMAEVLGRAGAKLIQDLGKKRVALITLKNDFGQALAVGLKEGAKTYGLQLVGEYEYGIQDRQFGPIIAKLKADAPDVIYASGYFYTAGPLVSQLRSAGITVPVIGQTGYDSEEFIQIAGDAAEGTYLTTSLDRDSTSPVTVSFLADYKQVTGGGADMAAATSYTATQVLIEGLKKTGGKGGEALRDALAAGQFDTPIGLLSFNDLHEVKKDVQVQVVRGKEFHRHTVISDPELLAPPGKPGVKGR